MKRLRYGFLGEIPPEHVESAAEARFARNLW